METSSLSVKEGEGFSARNTWSEQADSESFAQVVFFFFFFFFFEADFIQLVVLNLSHLNYIKLCLFLTSNER